MRNRGLVTTYQVQVVEQVWKAQQLLMEAHPGRSLLCWGLALLQLLAWCSQGQASEDAQQAKRGPRKQSPGASAWEASALKEGWSPLRCARSWMPAAEAPA